MSGVPPVEAVLESLPWASALVDLDGRLVAGNQAARRWLDGRGLFEALAGTPGADGARTALAQGAPAGDHRLSVVCGGQGADDARTRVRLLAVPPGAAAAALVLFEPLAGDGEREADLEARLAEVRHVKHEMSNALMGVIGHAELLARRPGTAERATQKAQSILEQCTRLQHLLEALTELTRR